MSLWRSDPQVLGEYGPKPEVSNPRRLQRYAQIIDIIHTHLGARGAMIQPFFLCSAWNHSTEPGWGTD